MRPPSSKNHKKNSDDDRRRKKKIKSKSAKRRRGSAISFHSSSSESEPGSRSRQKSSKSKKLEKRRKQSKLKKSDKRKSRKKRYYSDSSVSSDSNSRDSGGHCPTCSDSERSRSAVRKKSTRRKGGRKSSQLYESKHRSKSKRSRYRSPSCSTCSGGGRSRSRSLGRSPSINPIEGRFGGGGGCSPIGGRFGESGSRGQSPFEERYRYKDEGGSKRLRSVLAVTKPSDDDEDKIIEAYDDYPASRGKEVCDEGNKKRDLDAENGNKEFYDARIRNEVGLSKDSLVCETELAKDCSKKDSEAVGGDDGKESDDLEVILRQKALENFRKFRGRRPDNSGSISDKNDETSKPEFHEGSEDFMKTLEVKNADSLDDPNEVKVMSVGHKPAEKNEGSGSFRGASSAITCQDTSKNLKRVQMFSNEISADETSLPKAIPDKTVISQPSSGKVIGAEVSTSDRPASSAVLNMDNQGCKSNEPMGDTTSVSQFEQKTFSRVRDGETVQVKYKVYIPKKTPALARRQLQR